MTNSPNTRDRRGFTLMEMLVVLGILAILLALAVPRILGTQKKANISATESQLKLLRSCLQRYVLDMKEFPSTEQGLKALVKKPADLSEAQGETLGRPLHGKRRVAQGSLGQRLPVRVSAQARHHRFSRHLVDGPRRRGRHRRRHRQLEPGRFGGEARRREIRPRQARCPDAQAALQITGDLGWGGS